MFHTIAARFLPLLVGLMVVAPGAALADPESGAQMRKSILDMEAKSVRPAGCWRSTATCAGSTPGTAC